MRKKIIFQVIRRVLNMMKRTAGVHKTVTFKSSRLDKNTIVGSYSFISGSKLHGNVQVGDHSAVVQSNLSGDVKIGRYTSINDSHIVTKINGVMIGNFCSIARNCIIQEFNHITDRCTTYYIFRNLLDAEDRQSFIWDGPEDNDVESNGPIIIGNDVWIGAQVVILSGITIGNGAVVGANSTVTRNVPPYAVVGGTPAQVLKYRFPEAMVEKLLKLSWWDWDDDKIKDNRDLYSGSLTMEKLSQHLTSCAVSSHQEE